MCQRLGMAKGARPWIGIDLGGTKVFGVVLEGDEVTAEAKRKTPVGEGPEAIVATIAEVVQDLGGPDGAGGGGGGGPRRGGRPRCRGSRAWNRAAGAEPARVRRRRRARRTAHQGARRCRRAPRQRR